MDLLGRTSPRRLPNVLRAAGCAITVLCSPPDGARGAIGPDPPSTRPSTTVNAPLPNARPPMNDDDLRAWLENMVVFHRFTPAEVREATGLTLDDIDAATRRFQFATRRPPPRAPGDPLRVLPYPGGRHPRLGFLEGAIHPQRETKLSVFTPWRDVSPGSSRREEARQISDRGLRIADSEVSGTSASADLGDGYVVVDVPEAIFSNLGLTYLAHTHIPTIWDAREVTLPRLEWNRPTRDTFEIERLLPNGIAFGAQVRSTPSAVRMALWLRNGTSETLTGLRVQNCVLLARAQGFAVQVSTNQVYAPPYAAVPSADGRRWILTAWDPVQRCWGNAQCPCLHSDPQFPECAPGATVRVRGWLSFYEGTDIRAEFQRIEATGWRQ